MTFSKILVLIPTRNRSDLAINAISSVLNQKNCELDVVVSDNSTDDFDIKTLKNFCAERGDSRLSYISPPVPLAMTKHWDWAMTQAMNLSDASHFIYLTDRVIFKKNALEILCKVLKKYSTSTISYLGDGVRDDLFPLVLNQHSWSGELLEVKSSHMVEAIASRMQPVVSLPKMLNCCAPRFVLEKIKENFGSYFSSVAPDYNFAFSFLATFESALYLDIPLTISYGLKRSNGGNSAKGILNKDVKDFQDNLNNGFKISFDSPIDSILPFTNAVLHEYYFLKNNYHSEVFPEIDQWIYLRTLIGEINNFESSGLKRDLLVQFYKKLGIKAANFHLRTRFPLRSWLTNAFRESPSIETNPYIKESYFKTLDEALEHDRNFPREKSKSVEHLPLKLGINAIDNDRVKTVNCTI